MKKFFLALCLTSLSLCAIAQNQRPQQRGPRRMTDAVVDTAVINKMNLAPELVTKVLELQASKQEEMKAEMQQARTERGQRMSDADRKAMMERRENFSKQYRKQLRELLGDDTYILYLEQLLDARQAQNMMRQGSAQQGQRRQMMTDGAGQRQMRGGFGEPMPME